MQRTDYASQYSQQSDNSAEVRKRFSSSSYITSVAGILKFILIILFLISGSIFFAVNNCPNSADWYSWLYPSFAFLAVIISICLYAIFLFAIAKNNLKVWATLDIILSLISAIGVIITAVLSMTNCISEEVIQQIAVPLGLVGALLLAANAAATYIMAKYQEDSELNDYETKSKARRFIRRFTLEASHM